MLLLNKALHNADVVVKRHIDEVDDKSWLELKVNLLALNTEHFIPLILIELINMLVVIEGRSLFRAALLN